MLEVLLADEEVTERGDVGEGLEDRIEGVRELDVVEAYDARQVFTLVQAPRDLGVGVQPCHFFWGELGVQQILQSSSVNCCNLYLLLVGIEKV